MPTTSVSSPWGRRFVRPFLGAFAVILFGLLGHQLAQEPDATMLSGSSRPPVAETAARSSVAADDPVTGALSTMQIGERPVLELAAHDASRHLPWSELGSVCLLLAVVLLLTAMAFPRRTLLHWWLPRYARAAAVPLPISVPRLTCLALSISRT